jgi:transposase
MKTKNKIYSRTFKAKVALEALKEQKSVTELSSLYEVHSRMIYRWKKELEEKAGCIFEHQKKVESNDNLISSLYEEIGKLKMHNEWLKKKLQ